MIKNVEEIIFLTTKKGKEVHVGLDTYGLNELNRWKNTFDKFNLFTYKSILDIPVGSKYIIFCRILDDLRFLRDLNTEIKLYPTQKRIQNDSKNGRVHWVLYHGSEGQQLDGTEERDISVYCNALSTMPNNVTLITGAHAVGEYKQKLQSKNSYNIVAGRFLHNFVHWHDIISIQNQRRKIFSIANKIQLPYKSLNYNRLPRPHRVVSVAHQMHHQYTRALYSLGTYQKGTVLARDYHWADFFPEYEKEFTSLLETEDIYCQILEENDPAKGHEDIDLKKILADRVGWIHCLSSYFQLVTETWVETYDTPFVTEKSYKPFGMLQPFIVAGPRGNVDALRTYGYKMFDKWIDHSYDEIYDPYRRLKKVLKEFDRLYAISDDRWAEMLYEMLPDLLHNLYTVKNTPNWSLDSELVPILINFLQS